MRPSDLAMTAWLRVQLLSPSPGCKAERRTVISSHSFTLYIKYTFCNWHWLFYSNVSWCCAKIPSERYVKHASISGLTLTRASAGSDQLKMCWPIKLSSTMSYIAQQFLRTALWKVLIAHIFFRSELVVSCQVTKTELKLTKTVNWLTACLWQCYY